MKIALFGYGRVGKAIYADLVSMNHDVDVFDKQYDLETKSGATSENIKGFACWHKKFYEANVNSMWVLSRLLQQKVLGNYDLVINALPGFFGYQITLDTVELGCNIVDISFFPEDPEPIKKLAKEKNVIAVIDAGLAPGLWNMILAKCEEEMDTKSCICYVGGLPKEPEWPFFYKAPYHPFDVLEMYTRESRYLKDGKIVVKPALTDLELIKFNDISVEAFNTDGLRTLLSNNKTPTIIEKTLRYPGTAELMKMFRETGFFDEKYLQTTSEILFPHWEFKPDEKDITMMLIVVDGEKDGEQVRRTYKLYDEASDFSSMARTTGFTATAVVDLIGQNKIKPGFYAPEDIGRVHCDEVIQYLNERNVSIELMETQ